MAKLNTEVISLLANAMTAKFSYNNEKDIMREIVETKAFAPKPLNTVLQPVDNAPIYVARINTNVAVQKFNSVLESEGLSNK